MAISAIRAAKHLCKESYWTLSNREVQKILYICHMLYLGAMGPKNPLVEGSFQAWDYGPVHPDLYRFLRLYGSESIPRSAFDGVEDLDEKVYKEEILMFSKMAKHYPHGSASKLIAATHWEEGAWKTNYIPGLKGIAISNPDIWQEYQNYQKYREKNRKEKVEVAN